MIRLMTAKDMPEVLSILKEAIAFLKEKEVPQWQNGYPNEEVLQEDLKSNVGYVFLVDGKICGYSTIIPGQDPSYQKIKGKWLTEEKYATLHRVMMKTNHQKGSSHLFFLELAKEVKKKGIGSIRVDTHEKNQAMKKRLTKEGFLYCGEIILHDTQEPRLAYEKRV